MVVKKILIIGIAKVVAELLHSASRFEIGYRGVLHSHFLHRPQTTVLNNMHARIEDGGSRLSLRS